VPYASVSDTAAEHAVTVTSASKAWNLAGLKCAQVITSNHADAARWRGLPIFQVPGPTPLGIAASTAAYRSGGAWLRELVAYLDESRRLLGELISAELPGVAQRAPEATYLAWLDCAGLGVDDPATFFLRHARVAVSGGSPFGIGYHTHVRLNFGTSRALLGILRAMGAAACERRGGWAAPPPRNMGAMADSLRCSTPLPRPISFAAARRRRSSSSTRRSRASSGSIPSSAR
jgi:cystathionine beta-lyase